MSANKQEGEARSADSGRLLSFHVSSRLDYDKQCSEHIKHIVRVHNKYNVCGLRLLAVQFECAAALPRPAVPRLVGRIAPGNLISYGPS